MSRGRLAQAAAVAVGIGLIAAPAPLGYAGESAADVQRSVGPFAASVALTSLWPATTAVRWVNVALGPFLIAGVLVTAPHHAIAWAVTVAAGGTLVGTGLIRPETRRHVGGSWSTLIGASPEGSAVEPDLQQVGHSTAQEPSRPSA